MAKLHLIPDPNCIEQSLALAQQFDAAFEYNDFFMPDFLDDEKAVAERVAFYKALPRDRSADTLHGVFLDVTVHSDDRLIREASEKRVHSSLEIARQPGVRGVVFHTNHIPNFRVDYYVNNWVERNTRFWKQMLAEYSNVEIYIENMFDICSDMLMHLAENMKDEPRFGVCFDYAHACSFGRQDNTWWESLAPYIRHMHINDNDLQNDLHQPVGSGKIDWEQFNACMKRYGIQSSVLVEVKSLGSQKQSLDYMQKNRVYPFESGSTAK